MTSKNFRLAGMAASIVALCCSAAMAATPEEAARLKTELTPFGAERAGNKDGSIPAWTGGLTTATPGFVNGGRRPDPFASDKVLYSVTAKNASQYTDKLTEGTQALLKKYPDTFRLDVYPTRRTFAAPQWVYDNTAKNAIRASLVDGAGGPQPKDAVGGIPFPIPKTGAEVMWNHLLNWRLEAFHEQAKNYVITADGKQVMVSHYENIFTSPYYNRESKDSKDAANVYLVKSVNLGPPIRAGEAIVGHANVDSSLSQTWVYLTGQRRVRKLPNSCCDTPTPFSAGLTTFDELSVFEGSMKRFDWKLVGKKEMLIPYNANRMMVPVNDSDLITGRHLNPSHLRWELHRVWVVEATLKAGERHTSPKSRYYIDEDSWYAVLGDRWDAQGQLARMTYLLPIVLPEVPATLRSSIGMFDLIGGTAYIGSLYNEQTEQIKVLPPISRSQFSPDVLAGEGVR